MDSYFESVNLPMVWFQENGKKFSGNQAFHALFEEQTERGRFYQFIIEKQDELHKGPASSRIFRIYEKEYLVFISASKDEGTYLLLLVGTYVLKDIFNNLEFAQKMEKDFYNILENIYDDFTIINKDGIVEKVLTNFESVYGISAKEAVGMSLTEFEERKIFNPCVSARAMKSLKPETMMQVTLDNKYLMCTSIPIFDENGNLEKVISYTRDAEKYELLREEYGNLQSTVESYSQQLEQLRKELQKETKFIGVSQKIRKVTDTAMKIAKFDATVLITGESGVGKNMLADLIHSISSRKDAPFIAINCGAIPEHLLESELFGYEKGAFTGASQEGKAGLIELAQNGTFFLDEICDMPLHMQVKLLKVIQEKKVMRIGGVIEKEIDFRLIAATNKNIEQMVHDGTFREDLFYRLNVLSLVIPPLRERKNDIFPLVNHFTKKFNAKYNVNHAFSSKAIDCLESYSWPGNIREVENVVERMILTADEYLITEDQLPYYVLSEDNKTYDHGIKNKSLKGILADVEKQVLLDAYEKHKSTTRVAKELGISQASVSLKLNKYMPKRSS